MAFNFSKNEKKNISVIKLNNLSRTRLELKIKLQQRSSVQQGTLVNLY